ncbi:MAG: ATP-binding protein, partial [Thermotogaceae bacterium]|nr:ATP-binding protein [Thermotogaceae bacterium]
FSEWDKVFSDHVIATAILDRILHHSHIVNIRGKSYRLKEKMKSGLREGGAHIKKIPA